MLTLSIKYITIYGHTDIKIPPFEKGSPADKMDKTYWSKKSTLLTPYTAGEQPQIADIIKLNTNENPYPPSAFATKALDEFDKSRLRLYPHPDALEFKRAAAQIHEVEQANIFCGNGSDEVIALAFQAFFDDSVSFLDVTYSFYPVWAQMYGLSADVVPLQPDFTIDVPHFSCKNCIIPNPNAPTGIAIGLRDIERIINQTENVVIIDEAYVDFGATSAIPLTKKYPNLLVVRTLSKSHSLAGLRLGYAVGDANLIGALNTIKDSFNSYPVDALACTTGAHALLDEEHTLKNCQKIIAAREYTKSSLEKLGFLVLESAANFLFASHPQKPAADIMQFLREHGIIVRHFNAPRISEFLRISIGTSEQMQKLIDVLSKKI